MDEDRSVSQWISDLKSGNDNAANRLYERYFGQLIGLARQRLADGERRVADEDDVAASVFQSLCAGAAAGRFADLHSGDDLWRLLVTITMRKSISHHRRWAAQKRGGGAVRGESIFLKPGRTGDEAAVRFDQFTGGDPTPDMLNQIHEEHGRLMELLEDDALREVARLKFEGYPNREIGEQIGLTERSIERKLQRIRLAWEPELR